MKKHAYLTGAGARRKSDKLMTLKTRDLKGPIKDHEDSLMTLEEDTTIYGI